MKQLVLLVAAVCLIFPLSAYSDVVYSLDFSKMPDGNAESWFKENNFSFDLDADKLGLAFKDGRLVVSNEKKVNGLLYKEVTIKNAKKVRITWGIDHYPKGVDWEKERYRDPIMLIITFGTEKITSGSFFIPNLPYFIGIFLAENEEEGKAYTGSYYKKGGRYFCQPCGAETGRVLVTEFELEERFKKLFGQTKVPDISAFVIESDARDLKGKSQAFIEKIEFLSE